MIVDDIVAKALTTVENHYLGDGGYVRWITQDAQGGRNLKINEYGCADAANIQYTLGHFWRDPNERQLRIDAMQGLQDPQTGMFREPTHHPIHTTAHCVAALELFDARPLYPLDELRPYTTRAGLYAKLESLDWEDNPWSQSHQGAGIYAALLTAGAAPLQWQDWYFGWLRDHCDPDYGMSMRGAIQAGKKPPSHHMCGWFHYYFNHAYAKRPIPYPRKLIDSCIDMYIKREIHPRFGKMVGFMEIDWVFCMNRASRETDHRFGEVKELLHDFAMGYLSYLAALPEADEEWNDLHMLFGAMCAVSELQLALPGEIAATVPLKNVLDRRPFI